MLLVCLYKWPLGLQPNFIHKIWQRYIHVIFENIFLFSVQNIFWIYKQPVFVHSASMWWLLMHINCYIIPGKSLTTSPRKPTNTYFVWPFSSDACINSMDIHHWPQGELTQTFWQLVHVLVFMPRVYQCWEQSLDSSFIPEHSSVSK